MKLFSFGYSVLVAPMLKTQAFFDNATHTVTHLIWETDSGAAMIIDPVLDFEPASATLSSGSADKLLKVIEQKELDLIWVLDTHAHADHLSAGNYIREKTGAKLGIGAHITEIQKTFTPLFMADDVKDDGRVFSRLFEDGDSFKLGNETVSVIHTPGHTPACVCYHVGDMLFVGDTMFMPDFGTARTDFPGGDAATLYRSIQKILALPDETRIFVGHDYLPEGRDEFAWETTVAAQKENIHLAGGVSEADYVAMRNARDATLKAPTLILPSLQVNIRAGALPPESKDGNTHFIIPLNRMG